MGIGALRAHVDALQHAAVSSECAEWEQVRDVNVGCHIGEGHVRIRISVKGFEI
jgi:hypothetical protein